MKHSSIHMNAIHNSDKRRLSAVRAMAIASHLILIRLITNTMRFISKNSFSTLLFLLDCVWRGDGD